MNYNVIIPCGGKGNRVGLNYNKLFYKDKNGVMMIEKTLKLFLEDSRCKKIILPINDDISNFNFVKEVSKVYFVKGGDTREDSVKNALSLLDEEYVLIHDGDRPFVSKQIINNVLNALEEKHLSVIPALSSVDATIYKNEYTTEPVYFIQTPQGFSKELLIKSFEDCDVSTFRDEGSLVLKKCGVFPHIVEGEVTNIKITFKEDLEKLR